MCNRCLSVSIAALACCLLLASAAVPAGSADTGLMRGKQKTEHTVSLEATVSAAPEGVYRLWTTNEGVRILRLERNRMLSFEWIAFAWFNRAWAGVLKSLEHYCASSVQACASSFQ